MSDEDVLDALSDEELVAKIVKNNDPDLFGRLYDRYDQIVYNKCYGFAKSEDEAKDLTQDVFLKLFIKLRSFKGQSKFRTWLYSFTYNFCVNHVNRNKERKISDKAKSLSEDEDRLMVNVPDETLFQLRLDKLKQALEMIPPEDKSLILLKYQDDIPIKELMVLLDIGESAVKMRLKRAKNRIIEAYHKVR
ncbi:RNA polymerase sigma factor [Maribacter litopenaei]|uniref:RNA polymerase sigma factor n=1 Tax=Maribacter litopenaei TaxID=2976127 RepID=A0ABY5Y836_9FLAO|nr:RNA polymerase sigma factor [Maribacter litopenaei]UWX54136.1 RNA polymerase sigma factor [Maribacter litopenaei]